MEKQNISTNEGNGNGSGIRIPEAWNSIFGMRTGIQLNCSSDQLSDSFFNPSCENPIDQRDLFESALSSIVSSPANSHPGIPIPAGGGESIVLRELIGRLGNICNSGDISPQSHINGNNTNSCYKTPLNSPTKLNLYITENSPISEFPTDPGFTERAARFSTFGHGMESGRLSINQSFKTAGIRIPEENKKIFSRLSTELGDSMVESSVSVSETESGIKGQQKQGNNNTTTNGRKRKGIPKGKGKETESSTTISAKDDKVVESESDAKRSKSNDEKKEHEKSTKDYIHVRARRGQATDSHSLAERVRREKISERMKFLQDLVPGCNKVTGKAVMLDEIINYVQSLQRQVEFLSMKLATVNPRMDVNMEALLSKDRFQPRVSMSTNMNPFDASTQAFPYGFQSQYNGLIPDSQFLVNPLMAAMHRMKPDGFGEAWENDLHSVVKMALGQDQPLDEMTFSQV